VGFNNLHPVKWGVKGRSSISLIKLLVKCCTVSWTFHSTVLVAFLSLFGVVKSIDFRPKKRLLSDICFHDHSIHFLLLINKAMCTFCFRLRWLQTHKDDSMEELPHQSFSLPVDNLLSISMLCHEL